MPPRFAYWTILIDDKPTAFRAQYKEDLQPTFVQLQRTNPNAVMRWFARGKLWDNPEQAQWAARNLREDREKRTREWRPGGQHKDPRARFQKRGPKPPGAGHGRPRDVEQVSRPAGPVKPAGPEDRPRPKPSGPRPARPAGKGPWRPKPSRDNRSRKR